jgi:hypothetical protein
MSEDNIAEYELTKKFRDAAIKDGWYHRPTYGKIESEDRAMSLDKQGFYMMVLTREYVGKGYRNNYECSVSIWGPDGLSITMPDEYDWNTIVRGLRVCHNCGASDVDTQRYSFAGRCCAKCRPEMAKKHEYPGWCD